jgi:hypothetical protein
MNNSSSWNCFSWKRGMDNDEKSDAKGKHHKEDVPDEQFANLLGGKFENENFKHDLIKNER